MCDHINIEYEFTFHDGRKKAFSMRFDHSNMLYIPRGAPVEYKWTRLRTHQCVGCPFKPENVTYCPVAANLGQVAMFFSSDISYHKALVTARCPERTYQKETTIEEGLVSLYGLIMATSGCPLLDFLRPMARFHLPFATPMENLYRSVSAFLLRQYIQERSGESVSYDLSQLDDIYANVNNVNTGIIARLRSFSEGDAGQNAIAALDIFAMILSCQFTRDLSELEPLLK